MAKDWVTDQKWRDIKHQDLPDWVKRRVKELDHHSFTGKSFEYRCEPTTGRYQRRLRSIPVNTSKLHRDGIALGKLGKHEQAIACFDEAIRINEMDHAAWHRKGIELNALEKYNEAIECFERAIQINPRDKFAWNHRALSLCRLGNYRDAMACCNEAIKIDDTYPFAWCNRAIIAAHLEDFKDFEKAYRKARQLDPKGLLNPYFAEYLKDEYKELLKKSGGDIKRPGSYYCSELCLVHLQMSDIAGALIYAIDLKNYVTEDVKGQLNQLIDELEYRRQEGISVPEELIERAGIVLHQAKMGR